MLFVALYSLFGPMLMKYSFIYRNHFLDSAALNNNQGSASVRRVGEITREGCLPAGGCEAAEEGSFSVKGMG